MPGFHPDLRSTVRLIPPYSFGPLLRRLTNGFAKLRGVPKPPRVDGLSIRDEMIEVDEDGTSVRVRIYTPDGRHSTSPAVLWCHGGGYIIGRPEQVERNSIALAKELGIVVVAVDYRLAPEHPFPTPFNDCFAALQWLHREADTLGVDRDRIAVGGESAGGGIAAALALAARDRGSPLLAFQLLIYPMLDDRTTKRRDMDTRHLKMWSFKSNVYAWRALLGRKAGEAGVSDYAAPSRSENLSRLPPAWIGVGTFDLFYEESLVYAQRLRSSGVGVQVEVVEGAYHLFDQLSPNAPVARSFRESCSRSLADALTLVG